MPALDLELFLQPLFAVARCASHRQFGDRADDLVGNPVVVDVSGAQDFVTRDHVADRGDQRVDVPRPGQPGGERDVVHRARPVHPEGEPAPQLRRRQWLGAPPACGGRLVVSGCDEFRPRLVVCTRTQVVDPLRQRSDGAQLEHVADTQLDAALRPDGRDQLGGHQGVSAEVEERVVDSDSVMAEQVGKQCRDSAFGDGGRLPVLGFRDDFWSRQRRAVDFAVRRDRNFVDHHVGGRRHVFRQRRGNSRANPVEVDAATVGAVGRCHVAHQAFAQPRQVAGQDDGLADARVYRDRGADFAQFDPESADLHLFVGAADELDVAVGVAAGQITGPVEPGSRGERVGDESFRGQTGPPMVATRHMRSADVDFADHTDRNRLQGVVEQVYLGVDLGPADRHHAGALRALHRVAGGIHDGLGGPVEVVEQRVEGGVELVGDLAGQRLAADRHPAQGAPLVDPRQGQEQSEQRRDEVHRGDAFPAQQFGQIPDVTQTVWTRNDKPRTTDQGSEDLADRYVEAG